MIFSDVMVTSPRCHQGVTQVISPRQALFCLKGVDVYLKRAEKTNGWLPPTHTDTPGQKRRGIIGGEADGWTDNGYSDED